MITEDYVSFEVAKLLEEKGFEQHKCQHSYNSKGVFKWSDNLDPYEYSAPTHQMVMRWLREVHNIFIKINIVPYTTVTMEQHYYFFTIYRERKPVYGHMIDYYYSTYEEAVEAAIKYCLENLI